MEVLVATVLVVVIFTIASLTFTRVMVGNVQKKQRSVLQNRLLELRYLVSHDQIKLPYAEHFSGWDIQLQQTLNRDKIHTEAINLNGGIYSDEIPLNP